MTVIHKALTAMLLYTSVSFAQDFFSLQYEVAEPTEEFRDAANTGQGIRATFFHFVTPRVAVIGSAGYVKWGPRIKTDPYSDYKFVSVPVTFGINFLLSKGVVAPFVGLSVGVDYLRIRGVSPGTSPMPAYEDKSELRFGFSPTIGSAFHIAGPVGLMINGSYSVILTTTPSKYFALNAGLILGL